MADKKREGGLFYCVKHLCITEKRIKVRDLTFIACHMYVIVSLINRNYEINTKVLNY